MALGGKNLLLDSHEARSRAAVRSGAVDDEWMVSYPALAVITAR
jgi:hypothetical protein